MIVATPFPGPRVSIATAMLTMRFFTRAEVLGGRSLAANESVRVYRGSRRAMRRGHSISLRFGLRYRTYGGSMLVCHFLGSWINLHERLYVSV